MRFPDAIGAGRSRKAKLLWTTTAGPPPAAGPTIFLAILAGQSNMEGRSNTRDPLVDTDVAGVWQFPGYAPDTATYRQIVSDITPLNSLDPYAGGTPGGFGTDRVGPGEYIARQLQADNPGCEVLLVPTAVGGTTVVSGNRNWYPNLNSAAGSEGSLFRACINHSNLAYAAALAKWGANANIVPQIYFCQGEFDASQGTTYQAYYDALVDCIAKFRANITGAANAPVVIGSMIPLKWLPTRDGVAQQANPNYGAGYAEINRAHVDLSLNIPGVYYVRGPGDTDNGSADFLHYSPVDVVRSQGLGLAGALKDVVGPTMTSPNTAAGAVGNPLSRVLTASELHATFHIVPGANSAMFEISHPFLPQRSSLAGIVGPVLRWLGNGVGPAAGVYTVGVRARDGSGNYGPTQTITVTQSQYVNPTTFFTGGERGMVWDFEDGNVFQNIDGTVAANVGDPVGWVRDQSPNANHWIAAANNTTRPILALDSDGKRYLQFNGTSQVLFAQPWNTTTNWKWTTSIGVLAAIPTTPNRTVISAYSTASGTPFAVPIQSAITTGNAILSSRNDASGGAGTTPSLAAMFDGATKRVLTSIYTQGTGGYKLRDAAARPAGGGTGYSTGGNAQGGTCTTTRSGLGASVGATPSGFWNGRIYPGWLINKVLTDSEIKNGEDWTNSLCRTSTLP